MSGKVIRQPQARFLARLILPTGSCWRWGGPLDSFGYGEFYLHGRHMRAHRASWILHNGAIPEAACVCHHCDHPWCVNPAHLFLGSRGDNNRDAKRKGRMRGHVGPRQTHCHRGHLRTPDNLTKRGQCRRCANMLHAAYKKRRRAVRRLQPYLPQSPVLAEALSYDGRSVAFEQGEVEPVVIDADAEEVEL